MLCGLCSSHAQGLRSLARVRLHALAKSCPVRPYSPVHRRGFFTTAKMKTRQTKLEPLKIRLRKAQTFVRPRGLISVGIKENQPSTRDGTRIELYSCDDSGGLVLGTPLDPATLESTSLKIAATFLSLGKQSCIEQS